MVIILKLEHEVKTKNYNVFNCVYFRVAITFHENFSSAFQIRAETPQEVDDDIVQESNVKLYIDMSDSFIGVFIYRSLVQSYQEFVKNFVSSLGYNTNSVTLPIKEEEIIYGIRSQDSFDQFIVPGNVIAIIYCKLIFQYYGE